MNARLAVSSQRAFAYRVLRGMGAGLAVSFLICAAAHAEPDFNALADAIHVTENGPRLNKGEQYGVHSVHYKDESDARKICIRTCRHRYADWKRAGKPGDFRSYLSRRYCPKNSRVWERNVRFFYRRFAR